MPPAKFTLNAYWKGVLYSFVGAVVLPALYALQASLASGFNAINWGQIILLIVSSFVGFLVMFLTGLIHYPDGSTVHVTPQAQLPEVTK